MLHEDMETVYIQLEKYEFPCAYLVRPAYSCEKFVWVSWPCLTVFFCSFPDQPG